MATPTRWLAAALLIGALPTTARAQTLRGRVIDGTNEAAVGGAAVRLLGVDSLQVASVIADDAGAFSVLAPAAGEYLVAVERIGYRPTMFGPVRLRTSGFADVALSVAPQAVPVDSVNVQVDNQDPSLRSAGFYNRRRDGHGLFLEGAELRRRSTNRMADALGGLGGVRVITDGGTDVQLRGSVTNVFRPGGPQMCLPLIYIDGLLVADGKMAGYGRMNLETIRPTDVAGVEIYMGESSVPLQYARGGGACGAVLFWTRIR